MVNFGKMTLFEGSPLYKFKKLQILHLKVSTNTHVKIDFIQTKINKNYRALSSSKKSIYWIPKVLCDPQSVSSLRLHTTSNHLKWRLKIILIDQKNEIRPV